MAKLANAFFAEVGSILLFLNQIKESFFTAPARSKDISEQIVKVIEQSILTTLVAGFFVGGIMTIQFALQVKEFGALGYLGGLATSTTVREIGPLLIAFMLSGKVGAYTSAELGTMRVTEQIDAIRCLGADPIQIVVLPRFMGIVISGFVLLIAGLFAAIFGGALLAHYFANINFEEYLRHIPTILNLPSLVSAAVKCFVFSILIAAICTYKGYFAAGGTRGVGRAVVSTAVITMVCIVFADWFLSFLGDVIITVFMEL